MKVVCIKELRYFLTKGKIYDVISVNGAGYGDDNDNFSITVENDFSEISTYDINRFSSVSIVRDKKLNQLGI